jgi:malate synthase
MAAVCTQASTEGQAIVLSKDALDFVRELVVHFRPRVQECLAAREAQQKRFDSGELPDFFPETQSIRDGDWTVVPPRADTQDRRVEITGPAEDAKMVIGALNSGANVYMTDFEDSLSPTWENIVRGQVNLYHAVRRTISFKDSSSGKVYALQKKTATLFMRPRGWHLVEEHCQVNGAGATAALFDFGIYFFHNARAALANNTGMYFYLPKMEHYLEARIWRDVFRFSLDRLGLPRDCIRATVLIETMPAAFQMNEILWELQEFSAGLNCGRWDYIFR